jgi:hypothetical protein
VADTNIFARSSKEGRQFLVYSMRLSAKEELAMILPVPVPKNPKEDAVRFINLEKYEDFFNDLRAGFPAKGGLTKSDSRAHATLGLEVVDVGSFQASFVPAAKDFVRLDERFRLPSGVWDKLPTYKDYGFVVFQLKKGKQKVHPMAFEFPRAHPGRLFFPTVHIHDGKVHAEARFDHLLYCQMSDKETVPVTWLESTQPAGLFMKMDDAQGLLDKDRHCYQLELRGKHKNVDTFV